MENKIPMQKIGQLQSYVRVTEVDGAFFAHPEGQADQSRLIKMRILSEASVNLFVVTDQTDPETGEVFEHIQFLTNVPAGLEQIEFYYLGSFALQPSGGSIWLDTFDNTAFNVESVDPESFARIWEREERDPRILEIERAARHNQERMRAQMEADFAAHAARMEEKYAATVTKAPSPAEPAAPSLPAPSAPAAPASDNQSPVTPESGAGGNSAT